MENETYSTTQRQKGRSSKTRDNANEMLAHLTRVKESSTTQNLSDKLHGQRHQMRKSPAASFRRWIAAGPRPEALEPSTERPEKRVRLDPKYHQPVRAEDVGQKAPPSKMREIPSSPPSASRTTNASSESEGYSEEGFGYCTNCSDTRGVISAIVTEIIELQEDVAQRNSRPQQDQGLEESIRQVLNHSNGLKGSLAWVLGEIRNTSRMLHRATTTPLSGLPPATEVVPHTTSPDMRQHAIPDQSQGFATTLNDPRILPSAAAAIPAMNEEINNTPPGLRQDNFQQHSHGKALPPIIPSDNMKRGHRADHGPAGPSHSPHRSATIPLPGPASSPRTPLPSSRTLPSPPGGHHLPLVNSAHSPYSPRFDQAAHAAHFQDLQHQISTKSLALQTLQREHDQLLAAFSRSQIRCSTLDKKSQVSDHEINTLAEEKVRLQHQVEALESQLEDLAKSRDELHQQSSADGAQWRQIMAMSSQLQVKGADEARRHKAEREAWEQDRDHLQQRIQSLELKRSSPTSSTAPPFGTSTTLATEARQEDDEEEEDDLTSLSFETLRQETLRLRRRCATLEKELQTIAGETEHIDRAIRSMASLRERITVTGRRPDSGQKP